MDAMRVRPFDLGETRLTVIDWSSAPEGDGHELERLYVPLPRQPKVKQ